MSCWGWDRCLERQNVGLGGCGKLKFCGRCYAKGEKVKKALLLVGPEMPCSSSLTVFHCFQILIPELKHKVMLWLGRGELNAKVKNDSAHVQIDFPRPLQFLRVSVLLHQGTNGGDK